MAKSSRHRRAALIRWSKTPDRAAATAPARAGARAKWEREVDPDGTLDPAIRKLLADTREAAHMELIRERSLKSRQRKAAAR